jgi:hypothetical protein
MSIVYKHKNTWAIRLPFGKGLFFQYVGRDSYGELRSWDWTKYDFLDHVGFEMSEHYFGDKPEFYYCNCRTSGAHNCRWTKP